MIAYSELYLSDSMNNLGDMIEYAVSDLGFEPDEFFGYFITSGIAKQFGNGNPKYIAGMSGVELAEAVLNSVGVNFESKNTIHIDKGVEYWSGWIFAYYQWYTGRRFKDLVNDGLTLSTVFSMYILHEAPEEKFITEANKVIERHLANRKSRLAKIRKARGISQSELADISGVSLRMIQLYEQKQNDIKKAQVDTVLHLSKALGCEIEDLIG